MSETDGNPKQSTSSSVRMTPKLASRTFWLVVGADVVASWFTQTGVINEQTWAGVIIGTLTIWVGGKWVAGKNGVQL